MEKQNEKFPVNQTKVAGLIVSVVSNQETNRTNAKVLCSLDDKKYYVNVLFSGDKNEQFLKAVDDFKAVKGNEDEKPLIKLQGEAFFSKHKTEEGITHQNFSVISGPKFEIPKTQEEIAAFRSVNNQRNPENLQVQVRASLANDINVMGDEGKKFASTSIAHTYVSEDKPKTMYANVVIPTKIATAIKTAEFQKGNNVLLTAYPQQKSYEKDGQKVYTFNLIAKNISHDITQSVSFAKAKEGVENTAKKINSKTKVADKEKIVQEEVANLKAPKAKKDKGVSM